MSARVAPAAAVLLVLSLAVAAWAVRTETGEVFNVPFSPWSALYSIGSGDPGTVLIDGGTTVSEQAIAVGGLPGGDGTLTVTGAGSRLDIDGDPEDRSPNLSCGNDGACLIEVLDGGVISVNGAGSEVGDAFPAGLQAGFGPEAVGSIRVSGPGSSVFVENGAANTPGILIGNQGEGTFLVEDGGTVLLDTGTGEGGGVSIGGIGIPDQDTGVGLVTVTGAGSAFDLVGQEGTSFNVGPTADGTLEILDGGAVSTQLVFLGLMDGGTGTLRVENGASLALEGEHAELALGAQLDVGLAGTAEVHVVDGAIEIDDLDSPFFHGLNVGGVGGGQFTAGTGTLHVSGPAAMVNVTGPTGFMAIGPDGDGTLTIDGGATVGVENPDDVSGTSAGAFAGGVGTIDVSGAGSTLDVGVGLSMGISVPPDLLDAGTARVTVRDGGQLTTGIGGIAIGSTSVLAGDGVISSSGGVFNFRGRVEPGDPTGVLSVVSNYQQSEAPASTRFVLAGTAEEEASQLLVKGIADFQAGTVEVDLVGGFLPAMGDEFVLARGAQVILDPSVTTEVSGAADFDAELEATSTELIFRALADAEGLGACQAGQLKALGTLCKQHFACESKRAKKPSKDADGSRRTECLGKAEEKFEKSWRKTFDKASKKGDPCGIDDAQSAADVAAALIGDPAAELTAGILAGWNEALENKYDDTLRASLLKEIGGYWSKLLTADSKQMKKRNDAKRDSSREKARDRFAGKSGSAIQKAQANGVVYTGPDVMTLADETTAAVAVATTASASGLE